MDDDGFEAATEPSQWRNGHYLGTVIDGRWWKRYRHQGFFMRGNGHYWLDDEALWFKRLLTKDPLRIRLAAMTNVAIGTRHAGKWLAGRPIVKVAWRNDDGALLSSGIGVGRRAAAEELMEQLTHRMERHRRPNGQQSGFSAQE